MAAAVQPAEGDKAPKPGAKALKGGLSPKGKAKSPPKCEGLDDWEKRFGKGWPPPYDQDMTGDGAKSIEYNRKCTDILWIPIFLVWWVGMFVVAAVAGKYGEPYRLFFGTDFEGSTCGTVPTAGSFLALHPAAEDGTGTALPQVTAFPQMQEEIARMAMDGTPPLSMNFYGVCVDACPDALEFVCNYATQAKLDSPAAFPDKGAGRAAGAYAAKMSPQWMELMRCQSELAAKGAVNLKYGTLSPSGIGPPCETYMKGCWLNTLPNVEVAYRCMPAKNLTEAAESVCAFPALQDPRCADGVTACTCAGGATACANSTDCVGAAGAGGDPSCAAAPMPANICEADKDRAVLTECDAPSCVQGGSECIVNPRCSAVAKTETKKSIGGAQENVLFDQLATVVALIQQWIGDIATAWVVLLACGLGVATVLGFLWPVC